MFCLCFIPYALIVFTTLHLSHVLMAYSLPPSKKIKNFGEWRHSLYGCPYGGGCPTSVGGCAPLVAIQRTHRRNTPHAVRCTGTKTHAALDLLFACETSVCLQIANAHILYIPLRTNILYIYYTQRNIIRYIIFAIRRTRGVYSAKERHAAAYIYRQHCTPPQHCHNAARTDGRHQDAREHTARSRPDAAKGTARNGAI